MSKFIENWQNNKEIKVTYPIYKSKSLQLTNHQNKHRLSFEKKVHTFDFVKGRLFISDIANIPNKNIAPIINLMANIVRYDKMQVKYIL